MKTIRYNTFETNSSSCHAITFPSNDKNKFDNLNDFYVSFTLNDDDDLDHGVCDTTFMKAKYLWTTICLTYDFEHPDSVYPIDKDKYSIYDLDVYTPVSFNMIIDIIRYYLGDKCDFENPSYIDMDLVEINHASLNSYNWILRVLKDKESLYNYLFNDDVKVYLTDDCERDNLEIDDSTDLMHLEYNYDDANSYTTELTKYMHQIFDIGDKLKDMSMNIRLLRNTKWSNRPREIIDVLEDINRNLQDINYNLETLKHE